MTGSTCYANKAHCTAYNANNCTACDPAYYVSGGNCVAKYANGVYVAGLNKVVWATDQIQTWFDAPTFCSNAGMYLPNVNELQTVYNYRASFGYPSGSFWSSSETASGGGYRLNFTDGTLFGYRKSYYGEVLCLGNP